MLAEWPSQQSYPGFPASENTAARLTILLSTVGNTEPWAPVRPPPSPRCQQAAVPARGPAPPLRARGSARVRGRGSRPLLAIWPRQRRLGLCHRPTRDGWKIQFARFNKKCCRAAAQVKTTVQLFANALCKVKHKNNAWKQHSLLAFCLPFERGVRLA